MRSTIAIHCWRPVWWLLQSTQPLRKWQVRYPLCCIDIIINCDCIDGKQSNRAHLHFFLAFLLLMRTPYPLIPADDEKTFLLHKLIDKHTVKFDELIKVSILSNHFDFCCLPISRQILTANFWQLLLLCCRSPLQDKQLNGALHYQRTTS